MSIATRTLGTLIALLVTAPLALCQGDLLVNPANRILIVDGGKTSTVKIKVDGCQPTWSATSADEGVATVADPGSKASSGKSFKISAADVFGQSTTVTITATGVGENCEDEVKIEIQVFVVMDAKHVEVAFAKGDKGADIPGVKKVLAAYRKELKNVEQQFKSDLGDILSDMKDGTLPSPLEGPGGDNLNQYQRAMILMSFLSFNVLQNLFALYWSFLPQMAFCGSNALSLYGFIPFLAFAAPLSMQPGGCGLWDQSRLLAFTLMLGAVANMNALVKSFTSQVEKESAKAGTPLACNESDTLISDPGDGGCSPVTAKVPDESLNKQLEIQKLRAHNNLGSDNPNQGRITVIGQSTGASVTIEFQQLSSSGSPVGPPQEDTFPVDEENCAFGVFWPPLDQDPNLEPGTWRVMVTDENGNTQTQNITVPVS